MIRPALTLAHERWNARASVRCPGCQPGEWYGVPAHELGCPEAAAWYVVPPRRTAPIDRLLALAHELAPAYTGRPLTSFRSRRQAYAVNWLVRAAWRLNGTGG
jgi:hypothetical protein